MKTKEQILEWLDKQPWKSEFYEEFFLNRLCNSEDFIVKAFRWAATKSGGTVWDKRDTDFRKWYCADDKPRSWEEYCNRNLIKDDEFYISGDCKVYPAKWNKRDSRNDVNTMSKDLCEAFIAYMKLIQLRNAWVKDCDKTGCCFRILTEKDRIVRKTCMFCTRGLSFPTTAMADEFMNTFKDLLEVAKPLL